MGLLRNVCGSPIHQVERNEDIWRNRNSPVLKNTEKMKLYILRHGQTAWNKSGRLQGAQDIPLNENGRNLAVATGYGMKKILFDRVISSPLSRSIETAQLVLQENDGLAGKLLRSGKTWYTISEDIREISFGVYEGFSIPSAGMFAGDPKYSIADPDFHNFFDAPENYRPPKGGESFSQLMERTGRFLKNLAREAMEQESSGKEELLLISTHGAASRALLANIKNTQIKDFWYPGVPKNCSVSVVAWKKTCWKLLAQDVSYSQDSAIDRIVKEKD